jgi:hypothetical protein
MPAGLTELLIRLLKLLEQSRVLEGDHRLIGERLDQGDLARAVRFSTIAGNKEETKGLVFAHQRNRQKGDAFRVSSGRVRVAERRIR